MDANWVRAIGEEIGALSDGLPMASDPLQMPSQIRTEVLSQMPSRLPSDMPSEMPSGTPFEMPSKMPAELPSDMPLGMPLEIPSEMLLRVSTSQKGPFPSCQSTGAQLFGQARPDLQQSLQAYDLQQFALEAYTGSEADRAALCDAEGVREGASRDVQSQVRFFQSGSLAAASPSATLTPCGLATFFCFRQSLYVQVIHSLALAKTANNSTLLSVSSANLT